TRAVRPRGSSAAPRRPAVARPFREPVQGLGKLRPHRQDHLQASLDMRAFHNRAAPVEPIPMLPAFAHMTRTWDAENERWSIKILPGEYYVTKGDEAVTTVLGSCISACVRDPKANVGGM